MFDYWERLGFRRIRRSWLEERPEKATPGGKIPVNNFGLQNGAFCLSVLGLPPLFPVSGSEFCCFVFNMSFCICLSGYMPLAYRYPPMPEEIVGSPGARTNNRTNKVVGTGVLELWSSKKQQTLFMLSYLSNPSPPFQYLTVPPWLWPGTQRSASECSSGFRT